MERRSLVLVLVALSVWQGCSDDADTDGPGSDASVDGGALQDGGASGAGGAGGTGGSGTGGAGGAGGTGGSGDASEPLELEAPTLELLSSDMPVRLAWAAVDGATSYEVLRGTSAGSTTLLDTVTTAGFVDDGVTAELTYYYTVRAKADDVTSALSNEVEAITYSLDIWHWRNSATFFREVEGGAGTVVVTGGGMRVLTSTNGTDWTAPYVPGRGDVAGLTYGMGKFVGVTSAGKAVISTDGITWTEHDTGATKLRDVAFGGKTTPHFVAVGENSVVLTSPDGETWTNVVNNFHHTSGGIVFDYDLKHVVYGDPDTFDYFVIGATRQGSASIWGFYITGDASGSAWLPDPVSDGGRLSLTASEVGVDFGKYQSGASAVASMHLVGSAGLWAHAEETGVGTLTFTTVTAGAATDTWRGVAFDGTDTLALFGSARIMTCSISVACKAGANGWVEQVRGTTNALWAGTFHDGAFYGVGSDETIERRAVAAADFTAVHISNVTFWDYWNISTAAGLGDTVVIGVVTGHYLYSEDRGTTFAGAVLPVTTVSRLKRVGDRIYGVGASSTILGSSTGKEGEWTQATTSPTTSTLNDIASSGTLYLAVGNQGETFTSSDGLSWTHVAAPGTALDLLAIEHDGTQFVAVASGGHILTTSDGQTWADQLTDAGGLNALAVGDGAVLAVGEDGHTWLSTDHGDNWTAHHGEAGNALRDAHYFDGQFIVTGAGPASQMVAWTSSDGTAWTVRVAPAFSLYGSAATAGRVFMFGVGAQVASTY